MLMIMKKMHRYVLHNYSHIIVKLYHQCIERSQKVPHGHAWPRITTIMITLKKRTCIYNHSQCIIVILMCNDHDRPVQTKNDDYGLQARGLKRKNKEHYFEKALS